MFLLLAKSISFKNISSLMLNNGRVDFFLLNGAKQPDEREI